MTYKGCWTMWHRFDSNNVKYIRKFPVDFVPGEIEPGFTQWKRGTGPLEPHHYNNIKLGIQRACLGVPKSPETKLKMSKAKLGVKKTMEHRHNMSLAHQRRREQNGKTRETSKSL